MDNSIFHAGLCILCICQDVPNVVHMAIPWAVHLNRFFQISFEYSLSTYPSISEYNNLPGLSNTRLAEGDFLFASGKENLCVYLLDP